MSWLNFFIIKLAINTDSVCNPIPFDIDPFVQHRIDSFNYQSVSSSSVIHPLSIHIDPPFVPINRPLFIPLSISISTLWSFNFPVPHSLPLLLDTRSIIIPLWTKQEQRQKQRTKWTTRVVGHSYNYHQETNDFRMSHRQRTEEGQQNVKRESENNRTL